MTFRFVASSTLLLVVQGCFPGGPGGVKPEDSGVEVDTGGPPEETAADCLSDADLDGACTAEDCDDTDPEVFPGAAERCNGADDDCDGDVDEGVMSLYYVDEDGDGYGDPEPVAACEPTGPVADNGADCDDSDAAVHPGADERANGVDDDCDGDVDEGTTRPDVTFTASWSARGLDLRIANGSGDYLLGMAETGVGDVGWYGESCIIGSQPRGMEDYGYDVCHTLSATGGFVEYVGDLGDVGDGSTIFTETIAAAGNITYAVFAQSSADCWVWGDDVSYYAAFGCLER
jgi:hypothetical protein